MKQIFNIFVKDVKLFYPEILISLVVTAAFVKLYPQQWGAPGVGIAGATWLPGAVTGLLPVTWWLLIARAVHAESLVGERQFWITRPYRWASLLAAKFAFILAFVCLPFFIAQCILLREGGFPISTHLYALVFNLAMAIGIVVLPLLALAAVTATFPRMLLAVIIVLAYVAGVAYLDSVLPTSSVPSSFGDGLQFLVAIVVLALVIVVQYATRGTFFSRMFLGALALTLGVIALFSPDGMAVRLTYPAASSSHPAVQIAFSPIGDTRTDYPLSGESRREVELAIPIDISGIRPGTAIKADLAKVRLTGPRGETSESHWQSLSPTWLPGQDKATISVKINRKFFEQMKDKTVNVELSLAFTALQMGNVSRMTVRPGAFTIPSGSICNVRDSWSGTIDCRSPLRQPSLMLVGTRFSTKACDGSGAVPDGALGIGWVGSVDPDPAEFGLTSVWTTSINFERVSDDTTTYQQHLCTGAPLTFASYNVVEHFQQKITGLPVRLGSLAARAVM